MGKNPTKEEISSAIEEAGFLFEQEIANLVDQKTEYRVIPNWAFEDQDEGKSREIDFRAFRPTKSDPEDELSVFPEMIVECKNNTNPFVFIKREKNKADSAHKPSEFLYPVDPYKRVKEISENRRTMRNKSAFDHLGLRDKHYYYSENKKTVQFCKIVRNGSDWEAQHGGIYNSLIWPLVKSLEYRKNQMGKSDDEFRLWFPVVVLSGPLYEVDTSEGNELNKTSHVSFVRELDTESISGRYLIDFVTEDYLLDFISEKLNCFVDEVCAVAQNPDFVLREDIDWNE